ncbi:hypothetical protein GOP47_0029078 [Adiantum capillus-veneris]|nr:hypothetical protein GOP47_0029078 [Adiantum capillus-veneris]
MQELGMSIVLCICVLACLPTSHGQSTHQHEIHCSRERSRTAWKIIDEYLLPFVEQERYNLPEDCRLNPKNDMFREQELKKEHVTTHQWQCIYCKKMFRSEKFLDQHLDNRHSDLINYSRERCLADVCGALHCDYHDALIQSKKKKRHCNTLASDKNLHLCQSLARTCFPPEGSASSRRLNDFFLRQFCDPHDCRKGLQPFNRGNGRYGDRALYIALFVFVCLLLLLYYLGIYAHRSDLNQIQMKMKRISKLKVHEK